MGGGTPPISFTLTDGSLPPGLTLTAEGRVTGTPDSEVERIVTVTAEDSSVSAFSGEPERHITPLRIDVGPGPEGGKGAGGCGCAAGPGSGGGLAAALVALGLWWRRGERSSRGDRARRVAPEAGRG